MPKDHAPIVIVSAMSRPNRAIGFENNLLWHIPADLKRFKELTLHKPIIMGRKTFESILHILGSPLPGRTNIVITRDGTYHHEGATVVHSLEEAVTCAQAEHPTEIHIGGGAQLYEQALPFTDRLHITWIDDDPRADAFFPAFEDLFEIEAEHPAQAHAGLQFQWVDYVRKSL